MKYKITKLKVFLLVLMLVGLATGCKGNQNQLVDNNKDLSVSQVHTRKPINQSVANQAKETVIKEEEISNVKAVNTNKELLVALKVDNFNRFQLKNIEKKVKSDLKKAYPNYKILVSTDSKTYLELDQLEQKLQKDKANMKNLKKDFNNIKNLMKEQT